MKKMLSVVLSLLMAFSLFSGFGATASAEVPDGYTAISSGEELRTAIAADAAGKYYLTQDIEISQPIASFSGHLIGDAANPPTVSLTISDTGNKEVGLFRKVKGAVVIKNIQLAGSVTATGSALNVGALVGDFEATTTSSELVNIVSRADVTASTAGNAYVGGLFGGEANIPVQGKMSGLINYGTVNAENCTGYACIGGIGGTFAGWGSSSVLDGCKNFGTVSGSKTIGGIRVGGIIGQFKNYALNGTIAITNCYNGGTVVGGAQSGGIAGELMKGAKLTNCYNTGDVDADVGNLNKDIGGLIGNLTANGIEIKVTNCYNLGTVAGRRGVKPFLGQMTLSADNGNPFTNCGYLDESGTTSPLPGVEPKTVEELLTLEGILEEAKIALEQYDRPYLLADAGMEGGWMEPAFNKNILNYELALPDGLESLPELSYTLETPSRATASAEHASAFDGVTTVTITAEDGRKKVYTFTIKKYSEMGIEEGAYFGADTPVFTPDSLEGGQQITAAAAVSNKTPSPKSAALILVASRKNTVIAGAMQNEGTFKTGRKTLQTSLTLPDDLTDVNVTAFVVNNTQEFKLLSEPASFADNAAESYTASADPVSVSFKDLKNSILTMSGTPGKAEANYAAIALYPGKTINFTENMEDTFAVLTTVKTNAQGSYGIDIGMKGESGEYNFLLFDCETGVSLPEEGYPFYFASLSDRENMVKSLYAQTGADGLVSIMDLANTESDCVKLLGLDASPFTKKELTPASFGKVLLNVMKENMPAEEEMLERFTEQYNLSVLIEKLNQELIEDISAYQKEFELSESSLKEYNGLTAAQKKTVSTVKMAKNSFVRTKDIDPILKEKSVLTMLEEAPSAMAMTRLIGQYADYLDLPSAELTKYKGFNSPTKSKAAEKLLNRSYSKLSDFANAFAEAVKNTSSSGSGTGTGTGTGTGGNRGTTGNNVSIPVNNGQTRPNLNDITGEKPLKFQDLDGFDWAKEAIRKLYQSGVISGVTETSFEPAREIAREEFVKLAVGLLKTNETASDLPFSDADSNAWYAPYLKKAVAAGLTEGKEDGTFGIGENLTREDMAVLANRLLQKLQVSSKEDGEAFADDDAIAQYAKEAVSQLRALGIVNGVGENTFEPKRLVTRAEAVQVIYNLLSLETEGEKE